jgi:hypothetical protein
MKYFLDNTPNLSGHGIIVKKNKKGECYWYNRAGGYWQLAGGNFNPEDELYRFIEITKEEAFMELL